MDVEQLKRALASLRHAYSHMAAEGFRPATQVCGSTDCAGDRRALGAGWSQCRGARRRVSL